MKNIFPVLVIAILLTSCGNKEKILLNQVPAAPLVNPATSVLIKNNAVLYARLDSNNIIRGITQTSAFRTTDLFVNFDWAAYTSQASISPLNVDNKAIAYATGNALSPTIRYSEDVGEHWTAFTPTLSPALPSSGVSSTKVISVNYIDKQAVLLLVLQTPTTGGYARKLYKINTTTQQGTLLYSAQDSWQPVAMAFSGSSSGWMLFNNPNTYLSTTADGGATWSTPVQIDSRYDIAQLKAFSTSLLTAWHSFGGACFSTDGGSTWKKPANSSLLFYDVHLISASAFYALTSTGLQKSVDGGQTWTVITAPGPSFDNALKLYFQDEQRGMLYADQRLFLTLNGGQSWQKLLYPYPYIVQ